MRRFALTIAITAIAFSVAMPAARAATANRTWVSHSGLSSNTTASPPCNPQAPCDTFVNALSVTAPGGEVNCLDNGNFATTFAIVNVTQSVTIDCGGQLGGIDVPTAMVDGVLIGGPSNSSNIVVKLRNLTINNVGTASNSCGICIGGSGTTSVIVENCVIQNFNGGGQATGIYVNPNGSAQLNVSNTLIANSGSATGAGIYVSLTGSGNIGFALDGVRIELSSGAGLAMFNNGGGQIKGFVRDSLITNTATGIAVSSSTQPAVVSVYRSHVVNNSLGVQAQGSNGIVILSNSTIQANITALNSISGGALYSYGNNDINDNGSFGIAPTVIPQH